MGVIIDIIEDIGGFLIDKIIKPIVNGVRDIVKYALDNPLEALATIGLTLVSGGAYAWAIPLLDGGMVILKGGSFKDAIKAAALSYASGKLSSLAGKYASTAVQKATGSTILASIVGGGASRATTAIVRGQDPLKAFIAGGLSSGLSAAAGWIDEKMEEHFGTGFSDLTSGGKNTILSSLASELENGTLTKGQMTNLLFKYTNVAGIITNFMGTYTSLNDGQIGVLTGALVSSMSKAIAGNPDLAGEAFFGKLTAAGEQALRDIIDSKVNSAIDKLTTAYQKVAENAEALNVVVEKAGAAAKIYNDTQEILQNQVLEQDRLKIEYNKATTALRANPTQANADAANAASRAHNAYTTKMEADYQNIYKKRLEDAERDFNEWNAKIPALEQTYKDSVDWLVTESKDMEDELKPILSQADRVIALTLRDNIDEEAYRKMYGLEADADIYSHFLENGQQLPADHKGVDAMLSLARTSIAEQALATAGYDLYSLNHAQRKAVLDYMSKNVNSMKDITGLDFDRLSREAIQAAENVTESGEESPQNFHKEDGVTANDIVEGNAILVDVDGVLVWRNRETFNNDLTGGKKPGSNENKYGYTIEDMEGSMEAQLPPGMKVRFKGSGSGRKTLAEMINDAIATGRELSAPIVKEIAELGTEAGRLLDTYVTQPVYESIKEVYERYNESTDGSLGNVVSIVLGAGGELLQAVAGLSVIMGNNPNNALGKIAKNMLALAGDLKSDAWKAAELEMQTFSDEYQDEWRKAHPGREPSTATKVWLKAQAIWGNVANHPVQWVAENIVSEILQEIPLLIATGGTSIVAKRALKEFGDAYAKNMASRIAIGTGTTLDALEAFGGTAAGAFDEAHATALKVGMTEQEANDYAMKIATKAGITAVMTLAAMAGIGGQALNKAIFGDHHVNEAFIDSYEALKHKIATGVKVTIKEGITEGIEEALPQLFVASSLYQIDPSYDVVGSVAEAAILGKIIGAGTTGGIYTGNVVVDAMMTTNAQVYRILATTDSTSATRNALRAAGITDRSVLAKLIEFDEKYVSVQEAATAFTNANPDFIPTTKDLSEFIGAHGQEKLPEDVVAYIEPRFADADDVIAAAAEAGITLTRNQAEKLVGRHEIDEEVTFSQIVQRALGEAIWRNDGKNMSFEQSIAVAVMEFANITGIDIDRIKSFTLFSEIGRKIARVTDEHIEHLYQHYLDPSYEVPPDLKVLPEEEEDWRMEYLENILAAYEAADIERDEALKRAIADLAVQLDLGIDEILQAIAESNADLKAEIDNMGQDFIRELNEARDEIINEIQASEGRLADNIDAVGADIQALLDQYASEGKDRDEAMALALRDIAAQQKVNVEALKRALENGNHELSTEIYALGEKLTNHLDRLAFEFESSLEDMQNAIFDKMQEYQDEGMSRLDAMSRALAEIAYEQGRNTEILIGELERGNSALSRLISREIDELGTLLINGIASVNANIERAEQNIMNNIDATEAAIKKQAEEFEAQGIERAAALALAIQRAADRGDVNRAIIMRALEDAGRTLGIEIGSLKDSINSSFATLQNNINQQFEGLLEWIQHYEAMDLNRDEALAKAVIALSDELGISTDTIIASIENSTALIQNSITSSTMLLKGNIQRAHEATLAALGDVENSILAQAKKYEEAGIVRHEALQRAIDDQIRQTKNNIQDAQGAIMAQARQFQDEGRTRAIALQMAIDDYATRTNTNVDNAERAILEKISQLEESGIERAEATRMAIESQTEIITATIAEAEASIIANISETEQAILDQAAIYEKNGMDRAEAIQRAIDEQTTILLDGMTGIRDFVESQMEDVRTWIEEQHIFTERVIRDEVRNLEAIIDDYEKQGLKRDEAMAAALNDLAIQMDLQTQTLLKALRENAGGPGGTIIDPALQQQIIDMGIDLNNQLAAIDTKLTLQIENMESNLEALMEKHRKEGKDENAALAASLIDLSTQMQLSTDSVLQLVKAENLALQATIQTMGTALTDSITMMQEELIAQLGTIETNLAALIQEGIDNDLSEAEATAAALVELADQMDIQTTTLISAINQGNIAISADIKAQGQMLIYEVQQVEAAITLQLTTIENNLTAKIQEGIDNNLTAAAATAQALIDIAADMEMSTDDLMAKIDNANLDINNSIKDLGDTLTNEINTMHADLAAKLEGMDAKLDLLIEENKTNGMEQAAATAQALIDLAADMGIQTATLLAAIKDSNLEIRGDIETLGEELTLAVTTIHTELSDQLDDIETNLAALILENKNNQMENAEATAKALVDLADQMGVQTNTLIATIKASDLAISNDIKAIGVNLARAVEVAEANIRGHLTVMEGNLSALITGYMEENISNQEAMALALVDLAADMQLNTNELLAMLEESNSDIAQQVRDQTTYLEGKIEEIHADISNQLEGMETTLAELMEKHREEDKAESQVLADALVELAENMGIQTNTLLAAIENSELEIKTAIDDLGISLNEAFRTVVADTEARLSGQLTSMETTLIALMEKHRSEDKAESELLALALVDLAADLKSSTADVIAEISKSNSTISLQIKNQGSVITQQIANIHAAISSQLSGMETTIADLIQQNKDAGMKDREAIATAIAELSLKMDLQTNTLIDAISRSNLSIRRDVLNLGDDLRIQVADIESNLSEQLTRMEANLTDKVEENKEAGMEGRAALAQALVDLAADLELSTGQLIAKLEASNDALSIQIRDQQTYIIREIEDIHTRLEGQLDGVETTLAALIQEGIDNDLSEAEATAEALVKLAEQMNVQTNTLLSAIGRSDLAIKQNINALGNDLRNRVADVGVRLANQITAMDSKLAKLLAEYELADMDRTEALAKAIAVLSADLGVSTDIIVSRIDRSNKILSGEIKGLGERVVTAIQTATNTLSKQLEESDARMTALLAEYELADMDRTEALAKAIAILSDELGVSTNAIINRVNVANEELSGEIRGLGLELDTAITTATQALSDQLTATDAKITRLMAEYALAGMDQNAALAKAIAVVQLDLNASTEQVIGYVTKSNQFLSGLISENTSEIYALVSQESFKLSNQLTATDTKLTRLLAEYDNANMERKEALAKAIAVLSADLGVSTDTILAQIKSSNAELSSELSGYGDEILSAIASATETLSNQLTATDTKLTRLLAEYDDANMDRKEALAKAIAILSDELGVSSEAILSQIRATNEELSIEIRDYGESILTAIETATNTLSTQLSETETRLNELLAEYELADMDRQEALAKAIAVVSAELNVSTEEILTRIDNANIDLSAEIKGYGESIITAIDAATIQLSTQLSETETRINELLAEYETADIGRQEVLAKAIAALSAELGVSTDLILDTIKESNTDLSAELTGYGDSILAAIATATEDLSIQLTDVETNLETIAKQHEANGLTRDQAIQAAIVDLAVQEGVSTEAIIDQISSTEGTLSIEVQNLGVDILTQLRSTETNIVDGVNVVAEFVGKPARDVTQEDVDFVINLIQQGDATDQQVIQYDVTGDGVVDINDQNMLLAALTDEEVDFADTSIFGESTGLYAQTDQNTEDIQGSIDESTEEVIEEVEESEQNIMTELQTSQRVDDIKDFRDLIRGHEAARRVDVTAGDPYNVDYIYDFESIFANPQQANEYISPYGDGTRGEDEQAEREAAESQGIAEFESLGGFAEGGQVEDEDEYNELLELLGGM